MIQGVLAVQFLVKILFYMQMNVWSYAQVNVKELDEIKFESDYCWCEELNTVLVYLWILGRY